MKLKLLITLVAGLLGAFSLLAQGTGEVALLGVGGQNRTWGGFGGGALQASIPVTKRLTIQTGWQGLSSGTVTGLLQVQPFFPLKKGELFIDASAYYGGFYKNGIGEVLAAAGAGWRTAHFSAQLGLSVRWIFGGADTVMEPIDPYYRIAGTLKKPGSQWNISAGISNFTRYQVERAMQPIFFIEGRYRIGRKFSLVGELNIKPAGMFHLTATWYGFSAGLGVVYTFSL